MAKARKSRFSNVTIICPDQISGGPEALHQLSFELNKLGVDASIMYFERKFNFGITAQSVGSAVTEDCAAMKAYAAYEPRVIPGRVFDPDSLVIFPELLADLSWLFAQRSRKATACWMLAVPRAAHSKTMQDDAQRPLFMRRVNHFYQSIYARQYLVEKGARNTIPIFDYIDRRFVLTERKVMDRAGKIPRSIAYFPRKGGALAEEFFRVAAELIPGLKPIPIEGMTRDEVMAALKSAQFYIDFGTQPGKDRVPREAAALGAAVLLRYSGSATCYEDHPLDRSFLFSDQHVHDGSLARRLADIIDDPLPHLAAQKYYRQKIRLEREEFILQLRQFFLAEG